MCTYDECFNDGDCGEGLVCRCREGEWAPHICMRSGNCQVDSDCGDSGFCSPSFGNCGNYLGVIGWFCHTPQDQCLDDEQCGREGGGGFDAYCAYNPAAGRWMCADSHCAG
jgi:hypothetical protein